MFGQDGGFGAYFLLAFAASVAWARVALGKHSVLDCVAGSILGIFLVDSFEPMIGSNGRWFYQQMCLMYFSAIGFHCLVDLCRKSDETDLFGLREWLGFVDTAHQQAFIAGPVVGSWIFALGAGTCTRM